MGIPPQDISHYLMTVVKKPGLDTNPALGTIQRMNLVAHKMTASKTPQPSSNSDSLFRRFFAALDRIDKTLKKHGAQSFGVLLGGKAGNSKASTASAPTSDAVYLSSVMGDLRELFDIWDLLKGVLTDKGPTKEWKAGKAKLDELKDACEGMEKERKAASDAEWTALQKAFMDARNKAEAAELAARQLSNLNRRKFKAPGKYIAENYKFWNYFLKAAHLSGYFYVVEQDYERTKKAGVQVQGPYHKIFSTSAGELYSKAFAIGEGPGSGGNLRTTYVPGVNYEYVGHEALLVQLPPQ